METEKDKRSRNIGLMATLTFHGLIALIFMLLMAWRAPDPPIAEYGMEINLGFQPEGSGDEKIATDPGNEGTEDKSAEQPTETQPEETTQEKADEPQPQPVVTDIPNPVTVKESKQEQKTEVKPEATKETVKTTPTEIKKQDVNKEAVFNPSTTTDKTTAQKAGENKSEGNDTNKPGNKGQTTGTLDPNIYSGIQGGGSNGTGTGLDLAGWKWDRKPEPKLPENESGRLVFEIEVDENGAIMSVSVLESGLSAAAIKICKDEIMKLTFTQTGANVPEISRGKITFVVKAQ